MKKPVGFSNNNNNNNNNKRLEVITNLIKTSKTMFYTRKTLTEI
ncbi:MAG: hypothetical protein ABIW77_07870 [Gelidibacter sp.]